MMDHLSLKSWAAAEFTKVPNQAGIVAIATTLSNARMINLTNNENNDNAKAVGRVPERCATSIAAMVMSYR